MNSKNNLLPLFVFLVFAPFGPHHALAEEIGRWTARDDNLMSPIAVTARRSGDSYFMTVEGVYPIANGRGVRSPVAKYIQFWMSEVIGGKTQYLTQLTQDQQGTWQPGASFVATFSAPSYLFDGTHDMNVRLCMGDHKTWGCYPSPNLYLNK